LKFKRLLTIFTGVIFIETVLTVTALNRYLASRFHEDKNLRELMIKGEISNFTNHYKSGHFYFTLKDREAAVKAVMWASYARDLGFVPENGMNVIVTASVQVFERDGVYQLYCTDIVPDGIGKLYTAYEQLKTKLADEGLFDIGRKKELPLYPTRIGVITAKGAAALQDMVSIIKRRAPYADITLYETAVQGTSAAADIAKTIRTADSKCEDILIVGRGGGSFEDLFAFSDEAVVRAVADAKTPIISAVGHETDNPLCDLAADLRAPTPSAAAELAVPDISQITGEFDRYTAAVYSIINNKLSGYASAMSRKHEYIKTLLPTARINRAESELSLRLQKVADIISKCLTKQENALKFRAGTIEKLSPLAVLGRGYVLTEKDHVVVTRAADLNIGDHVTLRFSDGVKNAKII
jgi:exodeoxyribonuclease VII large subunit